MSEGIRIALAACFFCVISCFALAIHLATHSRQNAELRRIADSIENVSHAIRVQTKEHYALVSNYADPEKWTSRANNAKCVRCGSEVEK